MSDGELLGFVLTDDATLPDVGALVEAWNTLSASTLAMRVRVEPKGLSIAIGDHAVTIISAPHPVPGGEAEELAELSASRFMDYEPLGPHAAHLVVAHAPAAGVSRREALEFHWDVLAAVAQASGAVGVQGETAAHPADFVIETVASGLARTALWCGVGYAKAAGRDDRISLLSYGLRKLGLLEIELLAAEGSNDELFRLLDLVSYVARRGADLPDGDTVGYGDAKEGRVRYVESPIDGLERVCRIER